MHITKCIEKVKTVTEKREEERNIGENGEYY
jgi:hypothetical protein